MTTRKTKPFDLPEWPADKPFPEFADEHEEWLFNQKWSFADWMEARLPPKKSGTRRAPAKAPAAKKTRGKR